MKTELNGRHVFFMLAAFFGTIIAINVDLIIKAQSTFSGEDIRKPYSQGIDFNKTLARRAEQTRLKWHAAIEADRGPAQSLKVQIFLKQKDGLPLNGATLAGTLQHPASSRLDRSLSFKAAGNGQYTDTLANVPDGAWNIVVRTSAGNPFEAERRIWLH